MSDANSRRFVILTHDHPFVHWDLMLGQGRALRTWRLLAEPVSDSAIVAERLPDHRLHYLDYEGPVSGSRGSVVRWTAGTYEAVMDTKTRVVLSVKSPRLTGTLSLETQDDGASWTVTYQPTLRQPT